MGRWKGRYPVPGGDEGKGRGKKKGKRRKEKVKAGGRTEK